MFQRCVFTQPAAARAVGQEVRQLFKARHGRRAAVARHDEGAAGVGVGAARGQRLAAQPAAQEAGHEGVAGAEHVEDFHREAGAGQAVVDARRDGAFEHHAAHRPTFHHKGGRAQLAQAAQRSQHVAGAAGDADLFFRADDQLAVGDDALQLRADGGRFDVALLAQAGAGQPPQHGPVVDVEHHALARGARHRHRTPAGGQGGGLRQVRARQQQRASAADEGRVDVVRRQPHVGAVVAVEHQRERLAVADAKEDERGQPLRIGAHLRHLHAFGRQPLAHETAVVFVADARQHRRPQPQAGHADGGVGG